MPEGPPGAPSESPALPLGPGAASNSSFWDYACPLSSLIGFQKAEALMVRLRGGVTTASSPTS